MNIRIDKDAAAYIKRHTKENTIMLYVHSSSAGWCVIPTPTVQLEKPQYDDKFDRYDVDGISVYLRKDLQIKDSGIHVFLRKFLWIKELAVDGISINY